MTTYIKTLKEDNGDITYPQTKAGAVLLDSGTDLETELSQFVTAEDIASTSALTPPVQTNMIADGAVTSDKIDWTAFGAHKVWTGTVNLTTSYQNITTMDISNIPTGAVVAIEAVFQYTGDNAASGTTGNIMYNGSSIVTTYMVTTWARSNVALIAFTKVAGADTLTFRALKDNASASNSCTTVSAVAWRIG